MVDATTFGLNVDLGEDGRRVDAIVDRGLPYVGIVMVLAVWYAMAHLSGGIIGMMTPEASVPALTDMLSTPAFYSTHVKASLLRFGVAIAASLIIGLPLGVLVGYFYVAERLSSVVFQFLRIVSPIAWFPVAIAVFGTGTPAAIFVVFMAGVWPVIFNTAHGIDTMDDDLVRVGESLGGDTIGLIRKVVFPAVIPDFLSGVRISVGIAWIILVPAEMIGIEAGLGYLVLDARDRFAYGEIPAIILIIGLIGFTLDAFIRRLQTRYNWQ